jgi:hypothetical protein
VSGRVVALILVLAAAALAGGILLGGPVASYWKGRTADAEAGQERATDDAVGRGLEVQGTRQLGDAASALQSSAAAMRSAANALDTQARQDAPAAAQGLTPGALDRIRLADDSLCSGSVQCPDRGLVAAPGAPEVRP